MSNKAQGLVRDLEMDAPAKPILMAYANYADETGYCWPGIETIAFDCGYSIPTVVRVRRELIKKNWMLSKRRFGTSAATRLNLQKMLFSGVDRGDYTRIKPEFEFEEETPGQAQRDLCDLNEEKTSTRSDHTDLYEEITQICTTDHTDHLSINESSVDPSVGGKRRKISLGEEKAKTPEWATNLILNLDYGKHRRPNQRQASELAELCHEANKEYKLTRNEIRSHCLEALKVANKNGVSYLLGALQFERLPVHVPKKRKKPAGDKPAAKTGEFIDRRSSDWHQKIQMDPKFMPKRMREDIAEKSGTNG